MKEVRANNKVKRKGHSSWGGHSLSVHSLLCIPAHLVVVQKTGNVFNINATFNFACVQLFFLWSELHCFPHGVEF
jgi:hypothetical protein